jgi:hypothetical protein
MKRLLTEDQVERAIERQVDAADRAFMAGRISQVDYDKLIRDIDAWGKEQMKWVMR